MNLNIIISNEFKIELSQSWTIHLINQTQSEQRKICKQVGDTCGMLFALSIMDYIILENKWENLKHSALWTNKAKNCSTWVRACTLKLCLSFFSKPLLCSKMFSSDWLNHRLWDLSAVFDIFYLFIINLNLASIVFYKSTYALMFGWHTGN